MRTYRVILLLLLPALAACATPSPPKVASSTPPPCEQTGMASWYRQNQQATASGERPGGGALVAAHPTLPLGTRVQVTSLSSGQTVEVRIDDRGPFAKGRIIDLSAAAAKQLGMRQDGVTQVRLRVDGQTGAACPFDMAKGS
jgi:rare lipoprotein A